MVWANVVDNMFFQLIHSQISFRVQSSLFNIVWQKQQSPDEESMIVL